MNKFKALVPEHVVLKNNNVQTNIYVSLLVGQFSIEEGRGIIASGIHCMNSFSTCLEINKVCKTELLNWKERKFNKK